MMARAREVHAFANQIFEVNVRSIDGGRFVAALSCGQHLLDCAEQPVGIEQHQPVKFLALFFVELAALERFEIEADRGDRRFQFVRDGVDETVVLFVAADFADEEAGVDDHAADDRGKKNHAEEKQDGFAAVEDDPADVERDGERDEAHAQRDEKCDGLPAASDGHEASRGLYCGMRRGS